MCFSLGTSTGAGRRQSEPLQVALLLTPTAPRHDLTCRLLPSGSIAVRASRQKSELGCVGLNESCSVQQWRSQSGTRNEWVNCGSQSMVKEALSASSVGTSRQPPAELSPLSHNYSYVSGECQWGLGVIFCDIRVLWRRHLLTNKTPTEKWSHFGHITFGSGWSRMVLYEQI